MVEIETERKHRSGENLATRSSEGTKIMGANKDLTSGVHCVKIEVVFEVPRPIFLKARYTLSSTHYAIIIPNQTTSLAIVDKKKQKQKKEKGLGRIHQRSL